MWQRCENKKGTTVLPVPSVCLGSLPSLTIYKNNLTLVSCTSVSYVVTFVCFCNIFTKPTTAFGDIADWGQVGELPKGGSIESSTQWNSEAVLSGKKKKLRQSITVRKNWVLRMVPAPSEKEENRKCQTSAEVGGQKKASLDFLFRYILRIRQKCKRNCIISRKSTVKNWIFYLFQVQTESADVELTPWEQGPHLLFGAISLPTGQAPAGCVELGPAQQMRVCCGYLVVGNQGLNYYWRPSLFITWEAVIKLGDYKLRGCL